MPCPPDILDEEGEPAELFHPAKTSGVIVVAAEYDTRSVRFPFPFILSVTSASSSSGVSDIDSGALEVDGLGASSISPSPSRIVSKYNPGGGEVMELLGEVKVVVLVRMEELESLRESIDERLDSRGLDVEFEVGTNGGVGDGREEVEYVGNENEKVELGDFSWVGGLDVEGELEDRARRRLAVAEDCFGCSGAAESTSPGSIGSSSLKSKADSMLLLLPASTETLIV